MVIKNLIQKVGKLNSVYSFQIGITSFFFLFNKEIHAGSVSCLVCITEYKQRLKTQWKKNKSNHECSLEHVVIKHRHCWDTDTPRHCTESMSQYLMEEPYYSKSRSLLYIWIFLISLFKWQLSLSWLHNTFKFSCLKSFSPLSLGV